MKRNLTILALCLSLLFCGCSVEGGDTALTAELAEAISAVNSETRVSGSYMLEITAAGVTIYYALGDISWDREANTAYAAFSQTYLGDSGETKNYFSAGTMMSVSGGETITTQRDSAEIFSKFPYAEIFPLPQTEEVSLTEKTSTVGRTVTVTRNDTKDIFNTVIGGDIFSLVGVIKKPQPEKTQYGETTCIYTLDENGVLTGCRYQFDVKLFDTPGYVPGYSVPESEYTLDLHITAKISYKQFGAEVEVPVYKGEGEESSQIPS